MPRALALLALFAGLPLACSRPSPPGDAGATRAEEPAAAALHIDLAADEVRVLLVAPGGAAEQAGFRPGDRLLAGDGEELASEAGAERVLARAAPDRPIFFEVQRGRQLLTLPLRTATPAWHLLGGGTLRAALLGRVQAGRAPAPPRKARRAPLELELASLQGRALELRAWRGAPLALLLCATFSEPSGRALGEFAAACAELAPRGLACLAVNTLDLFTAAARTEAWAGEVLRIQRELAPAVELALDLPMRAERALGVQILPTLVLVDPRGFEARRWSAPLPSPGGELAAWLDRLRAADGSPRP